MPRFCDSRSPVTLVRELNSLNSNYIRHLLATQTSFFASVTIPPWRTSFVPRGLTAIQPRANTSSFKPSQRAVSRRSRKNPLEPPRTPLTQTLSQRERAFLSSFPVGRTSFVPVTLRETVTLCYSLSKRVVPLFPSLGERSLAATRPGRAIRCPLSLLVRRSPWAKTDGRGLG